MEYIQVILLVVILGAVSLRRSKKDIIKQGKTSSMVIDSCGLIDGRIIPLVKGKLVDAKLIIPQFVIAELQLLADGNDSQKRERARYGLTVIQQLQEIAPEKVEIAAATPIEPMPTDEKLVWLAGRENAMLYTIDFNLNQVATIKGIHVVNINEIAQELRPAVLPGEVLSLTIVQKGSAKGQGVGYLPSGTMVVVDGAASAVNKTVQVKIDRYHQTVAGIMCFATLLPSAHHEQQAKTLARRPAFRRQRNANRFAAAGK